MRFTNNIYYRTIGKPISIDSWLLFVSGNRRLPALPVVFIFISVHSTIVVLCTLIKINTTGRAGSRRLPETNSSQLSIEIGLPIATFECASCSIN